MFIDTIKKQVLKSRRRRNDVKLGHLAVGVDVFLVSYPKCGRTWLRFILSHYFAANARLGFVPDLASTFRVLPNFDCDAQRGIPGFVGKTDRLPLVAVSHRRFVPELFRNRPVILLLRDTRDVIVSAYFHQSRQKKRFSGTLAEFIESPKLGVPALASYLNDWTAQLANRRSHVTSYEALTADAAAEVTRMLEFIGFIPDPALLAAAIEAADFDRMREMEINDGIPGHSYDRSDAEALRARKGKVGGYADYLSVDEADRVMELCRAAFSPETKQVFRDVGLEI